LTDFDPNKDMLLSYTKSGVFEVARFDLQGHVRDWQTVQDPSYQQTLQSQWTFSERPDVLKVSVTANKVILDLSLPALHEAVNYADWTLGTQVPISAGLSGTQLTLGYTNTPTAGQVLDLSRSEFYSSLGLGWTYKSLYLGDGQANTLTATQSQSAVLWGGGGNDSLTGSSGDDALLIGAGGTSFVIGGTGADVFRFDGLITNGGSCTITDFSLSQGDKLDLENLFVGLSSSVDYLNCVSTVQVGDDLKLYMDTSGQASSASANAFSINLMNYFSNNTATDYLLARLSSGNSAVIG